MKTSSSSLPSVAARLELRFANSAILNRAQSRLESTLRRADFYQNGPRHYKPLWVEIPAQTREDRTAIADSGVAIAQVKTDSVVGTVSRQDALGLLEKGFLRHKNLAKSFLDPEKIFPPKDARYHDYDEMVNALKASVESRPDIARLFSIGKTLEGRDIWAVQINQGFDNNKPGAVFVGTHHAREHLSTEIPLMLVEHLIKNANDPQIAKLIAERDITIIPMLNADGVQYDINSGRSYENWRKNRRTNPDGSRGVDLNRNYSVGFGGSGSSGNTRSETYRGPSAFSEPETQAFRDFILSKSNVKVLLTYHTFSELILYPWGHKYDPLPETDRVVFEKMAKRMAEWTHYTPEPSNQLYLASGETCDWAYGTRGIFAFTFELTPSDMSGGGFYPGPDVIEPTFANNLPAALFMIDLADNPRRVLET